MQYKDGKIVTDAKKRATSDAYIRGWNRLVARDPESGFLTVERIIRNTYSRLTTIGKKVCYVYCVDKELGEYLKEVILHKN